MLLTTELGWKLESDGDLTVVVETFKELDYPFEVIARPISEKRSLEQNALMWGARFKDIATQVWVGGRQYDSDTWHEQIKRQFLPELFDEDYDLLVTSRYRKWKDLPNGERICTGSTTQLTKLGMTRYLEAVDAHFTTTFGVRFSELGG